MEVVTHKNLIIVVHNGTGDKALGARITSQMRTAVTTLRKEHARIGIYHDVSALSAADNDYVSAFAVLAKELGTQDFVYVATIPKAWVRVLAKTASYLGGIETHFFKTPAESANYLSQTGFELPLRLQAIA